MSRTLVIFRRELAAYFNTPVAYVFIVIFLFMTGIFTFYLGNFFQRGQADLKTFFMFHPWLYLFLIPAVGMRLWAEERKTGTIEFLLTLPVTSGEIVLGKFLAAWVFAGIALALTFPMWLTVDFLGDPDHGVVLASYIGSLLMAGAYLAIGSCMSAITRNQVIAFVVPITVCFLFTVSGAPIVLDFFAAFAPQIVIDWVASFSFLRHFEAIANGVIDLRDLVYFLSIMAFWLFANVLVVESKKAG